MPPTPSDQPKEDQRRHPRYSLHRPLIVINTLTESKLGTLVNISEEGLMVLGGEYVADGHVYQVQVAVTNDGAPETILRLGIECLWTNDADSEETMWSGYRIIDISDNDKELLSALISQLH